MNLPKFGSMPHLDQLRREMDRLFENYVGSTPGDLLGRRRFPPVDAWEEGNVLLVQAEVPGVSMDHIEVYARGCELTLKGSRLLASTQNNVIHRQEQQSGDFDRTITLPIEVEPEHIEATLKDGLLTIRIPKPPIAQARRISVRGDDANPAAS